MNMLGDVPTPGAKFRATGQGKWSFQRLTRTKKQRKSPERGHGEKKNALKEETDPENGSSPLAHIAYL